MNNKSTASADQQEKKNKTYRQIVSSLEQVIWVEDPLIVCPQMGANSLAWSKAHLDRYLSPAPLPAHYIETTFFIHQLGKREIMYSVSMFTLHFLNCH